MIQKLMAEGVGTGFLLATVVGSGIMAETLAGGNVAVALLGNTLATGAILTVLITVFGPVSGAHFNPVVTLVFWLRRKINGAEALAYVAVQAVAGVLGVWAAHLMFDLEVIQISSKLRAGLAQGFSEVVATFGLLMVILGGLRHRAEAVPMLVGLYITAAYWFTASTSFANPAVTFARMFSNTFAGIAPANVLMFMGMQLVGALLAFAMARVLFARDRCVDNSRFPPGSVYRL
jgi:glycerol uptake facilitator-like aquaporin